MGHLNQSTLLANSGVFPAGLNTNKYLPQVLRRSSF